jgi:predicted Zn-ribbon and HTH transcriptional regulator
MNNLYRSLEEMSLMTFPTNPTKNEFVIEMIPKLTNSKEFKLNKEEIEKISKKILKDYFFNLTPEILRKELEPINEIYSIDNMEYFMDDPKCANCGKNATSRCSRCKSEWYCSKECQIKRWKVHKELCKTLSELFKEEEENKKKK